MAEELSISKVRCSPFHLSTGADPVGSAGAYDAFLCVEVALPWERDISATEPFSSLGAGASVTAPDGRRWRPQGLVARPGAEGWTRVLAFERPLDDAASPFLRREWWIEPERVEELCRWLLDGGTGDPDGSSVPFDECRIEVDPGTLDLFVCTHGRRDTCCGGLGAALHDQVAAALDGRPGVRVWRVSHTGGHRFAPTALSFPDGYAWAHLDLADVLRIVERGGPAAAVTSRCRGSSMIDGAPAQTADRAVFEAVGWDWLLARRTVTVVGFDRATLATDLVVHGVLADGSNHRYSVRVEVERHVPQPTCGLVDGPEYAVEAVWRIARLEQLQP